MCDVMFVLSSSILMRPWLRPGPSLRLGYGAKCYASSCARVLAAAAIWEGPHSRAARPRSGADGRLGPAMEPACHQFAPLPAEVLYPYAFDIPGSHRNANRSSKTLRRSL